MSLLQLIIAVGSFLAAHSPAQAGDIRFASPSGNITCMINEYTAACQINDLSASFTQRPADCDGDWGRYFYVVAGQAGKLGCLTARDIAPAPTLDYGQSISAGPMTCLSQRTGMTCNNSVGGGFSIRRSEQRLF